MFQPFLAGETFHCLSRACFPLLFRHLASFCCVTWPPGKDEENATQARLFLVDLAGSERVKDSCAAGASCRKGKVTRFHGRTVACGLLAKIGIIRSFGWFWGVCLVILGFLGFALCW